MTVKRALVCSPVLPEFDRESGSRRIFDLIDLLRTDSWAVSFISQASGGERYVRLLQQRGVVSYTGCEWRAEEVIASGQLDLAILAFWHTAERYLPLLRRASPRTRVIVDSVDLHFVRNARRALVKVTGNGLPGLLDGKYGSETARELNVYAAADAVLTVSQKEAELINDLTADARLASAVPDCEDLPPSAVPFKARRGILFVGNFRHPPNVDAVEYLIHEILPRLDPNLLTEHPVWIVGNALPDDLRQRGSGLPHVRMVGWVPSVIPYLEQARVTVLPLLYGAGTKRKLIQALMVGTPAVSTSIGVEALGLSNGEHVLVADDSNAFAVAVTRLLTDEGVWRRLAGRGRIHVTAVHGREVVGPRFREVISAVLRREPKPALLPEEVAEAPRCTPPNEYRRLIERIRGVVDRVVPVGAIIVVVSKGDEELLKFNGRQAWHFPQDERGAYAGYYPADSTAAIAHLSALRQRGGQHILFPATARWWLKHYTQFRLHLDSEAGRIWDTEDCVIFQL
jgi:glycosyltransferase involved in cell wall biosynthesis